MDRADEVMVEPYRSRFIELIRSGAATRDIHDAAGAIGYAAEGPVASEAFIAREVARVRLHQRGLCQTVEEHVGPVGRILDVGCSTGGTTVALALSGRLAAREVVGVDPNRAALEAAEIRAAGYGLFSERIRFQPVIAGQPLPFPSESFDLTTCVSVLEFVSTSEARQALVTELCRVLRPGGYLFLATPSPLRLREYHSRRFLGDHRRRAGYPWSSSPRLIRRMLSGCEIIPLEHFRLRRAARRRGVPDWLPLYQVAQVARWLYPWQQYLARKRL